MIKVILWDIDGTLLNFHAAERAAIRTLFAKYGLGECTDTMLDHYAKINLNYWERLERGEIDKPSILVGRFHDFFKAYKLDTSLAPQFNRDYQLALGDTIVFNDDGYNIVKSLAGSVGQYAVSNGTVVAQTKKLRTSGLDKLFDGIYLSEKIGAEKPSILFFDKVFADLQGFEKDEMLIVGDSLTSDILGGNNAGIPTCWYNPSGQPANTTARIDFEIKDLHEVVKIISESRKSEI